MKLTCISCCSYDAEEGCMNGIGYPVQPGDCCGQHETQAEFDADARAIARFRERLGLSPQRPFGIGDDEGGGVVLV